MKKIFSIVLSTALLVTTVACSTSAPTNTNTNTSTGESEKFIIGSVGPLTGAAASYGTSVKQGTEIAIEEINAKGGVKVGDKTYTLELKFVDDEAAEDVAATAYDSLMDSGMNVLLGCVTSGSTLAILDKIEQDGILAITPSGSAEGITKPSNMFRLCFTDPLQGKTIANFVVEKGYQKIAALYNNADEYSTGTYEAFKKELGEQGKSDLLVVEESFTTEDVDYTTQLTKIKAAGVDAIFVPAYYQAAAYITQQAKAVGLEADFIGSDGWDGVVSQVTDTEVLEGAVFLSPFLATDPSVKAFVDTYNTKYKAIPDQFAADGYDTVYVIKAAMEKAGSIENADLIAAMTEIEVSGLTGNVSFDASGEPSKEAKFVQIKSGEYVSYKAE